MLTCSPVLMLLVFSFYSWDTAGAERFKCIAASYYRGANSEYGSMVHVIIVVQTVSMAVWCMLLSRCKQ
jgi:hypothetical protein